MKKLIALMLLFSSMFAMAQTPQAINYQAIASDENGPIVNADVTIEVKVLQMAEVVYTETHVTSTNPFGHYNLQIGLGTATFADFAGLDWAAGNMSLEIGMDQAGGTNYQNVGVAPLLAVPYAIHALNGPIGPTGPEGPPGSAGNAGENGYDGLDGAEGPSGQQGPTGPDGVMGPPGNSGAEGSVAADGADGADGTFCFDLNGNGMGDGDEDMNGDGIFDSADCNTPWTAQAGSVSVSADVGIGISSPSEALHVIGNICHTGTSAACSDERYKTKITEIKSALEAITSLRGVTYNWKVDEFPAKNFTSQEQLGVIAQEVDALFPQIVLTDENGFKSVDYGKLTAVLTEAVKEQQNQINNLQQKHTQLRTTVGNRLEALEALLLESGSTENN